jgi:serine protease Do
VMSVVDTGPAARAGIEEGHRIAAINGVDLRVSRDDRGDPMVSQLRVRRLQRELAKVKAGDQVELRVYAGGQYRTVRVRTVKTSELAGNRTMIMGDGFGTPMPARTPMPPAPPAALRRMLPSRVPMRMQQMQHARPGEPGRARVMHQALVVSRQG